MPPNSLPDAALGWQPLNETPQTASARSATGKKSADFFRVVFIAEVTLAAAARAATLTVPSCQADPCSP